MPGKPLISFVAVMIGILLICVQPIYAMEKTYSEEDIGIRKGSLYDESTATPSHGQPITKEPGMSRRFERSFENSPPLIPHDITGMLPIVQTANMCMGCHMPDAASGTGATAIPKSHFLDIGTGRDLGNSIDGKRYNCMQCHVIQTSITPPVKNLFKREFRSKEGKFKSNLVDKLNEGVKAE